MSGLSQSSQSVETRRAVTDSYTEPFIPDGTNTRLLRNALGCFGTGVTIVTINTESGPIGMTVNSFASVSLDPALIQWAVAKNAGRYEPFVSAAQFSINVLQVEHRQLAYDFSSDAQAFDAEQWVISTDQPPRLKNALASFRCGGEELHDGGDHTIIVGKVLDCALSEGLPLLFFKGEFGHFSALEN